MKECSNCGAVVDEIESKCRYCTHPFHDGTVSDGSPVVPNGEGERPPEADTAPGREEPRLADYMKADEPQMEPPVQPPYQPPQPGAGQGGYPPPPGQQPYAQQPGGQYQQPPGGQGYPPPPYGGQQQYNQGSPYNHTTYVNVQQPNQQQYGPNVQYRDISKIAAGIFAILLGSFGVHKFYMGRVGIGILCVLFCWTGIPSIVGLIEGIIYLCMDDYKFREKYARRY